MKPDRASGALSRSVQYAFLFASLALCTYNIYAGYSYWLDELHSVTASLLPLDQMYALVLSDVHPPLYQLILSAWMRAFGDSELATRGLSWSCAVLSLLLMFRASRQLPGIGATAAILFFASNHLLTYYAQETRSYALMLLLGTAATTQLLSDLRSPARLLTLLPLCLLLALTHYFGLIYGGLIILLLLFENRRDPKSFALIFGVGVAMLIWPVVHALTGDILNKSGGNFWIKVDGLRGTLRVVTQGLFPWVPALVAGIPGTAFVKFLPLAGLLLLSVIYQPKAAPPSAGDSHAPVHARLLYLVVAFVAVLAIIDRFTPMSTARNYIVLLPAVALLFGTATTGISQRIHVNPIWMVLPLIIGALFSLQFAFARSSEKWTPEENWKETAAYAAKTATGMGGAVYYVTQDIPSSPHWLDLVHNHYLKQASGAQLHATRISAIEPSAVRLPAVIIYGHMSQKQVEQLQTTLNATFDVKSYIPEQIAKTNTGAFFLKNPSQK